MALNKLFSSFTASTPEAIKPLPERKLSLQTLLTPALKIFTKLVDTFANTSTLTRLSETEKQDLLQKTILDTPQAHQAIKPDEHMTSLLGQIHADALAKQTSLEQLPSHVGARAWANLMRGVTEITVPEDVQKSLNQYATVSERLASLKDKKEFFSAGKEVAKHIHALKVGESFLLEGGRTQNGIQCPAVFEFIRTEANTFDLFVYLPGNHPKLYHEGVSEEGRKKWNRPIIHYRAIPADTHLFFGQGDGIHNDFFQAIIEARFNGQLSPEYVTLHLLAHLQAFRHDLDIPNSERRALTDVWSSLKPFALRKLEKEKLRKAMLQMKLNSLIQGYQLSKKTLSHDTPDSEKLRIVLKRGAQLILKDLASFHNSKIVISESLYTNAHATALDLIDKITEIENGIKQQRKAASKPFTMPKTDEIALQTTYSEALNTAKKQVKNPTNEQGSIHSTRARLIDLPSAHTFPDVITRFVAAYQKDVTVVNIQAAEIAHLVKQMPIPTADPQAFWNKIPPQQLLPTMQSLGQMASVYKTAIHSKSEGVTAQEANIVYTLFAVIHHLALAQDRVVNPSMEGSNLVSLAHYPIYFPGMESDQDQYLCFTSPLDYKRREELITYFKGHYQTTAPSETVNLFDFNHTHYIGMDSHGDGLAQYLSALAEDPRFDDEITAEKLTSRWRSQDINGVVFPFISDKIKKAYLADKLCRSLNPPKEQRNYYDEATPTVLADKGFGHLPILAQAALTARSISRPSTGRDAINTHMNLYRNALNFPYSFHWEIKSHDDYSHKPHAASSPLHPTLRKDQKDVVEKKWMGRNKSMDTSFQEGEVLSEIEAKNSSTTDEVALLRASCEPSLFPQKLLSYFRSKLSLFESFEEQSLFEISLLRSAALETERSYHDYRYSWKTAKEPYSRTRSFPLADEMQQSGFQNQAKLFIQEGIDRYFYRQPNQKPKVLAATLFIRLANRLSTFTDGPPLINSVEIIEKMLGVASITTEERSLLSLHLVHAYSTLKRPLSQEEIEKAFGAWVFYKNTPVVEWHNPLLEREAETLIHQASSGLSTSDETFQRSMLKTALKQLGVDLPASFSISASEPHLIEGSGDASNFWKVNILTGEVQSPDGILRRTKAPEGLQDQNFDYLFGTGFKCSYFETPSCYYFSHPTLGSFRALKKDRYERRSDYPIQKLIGSRWYQYVKPESCLQKIPRALCGGHTHWISTDGLLDLMICNHDNGKISAKITATGLIQSDDPDAIIYWSIPENTLLPHFERPEYIHWTVNKEKKTILTFWRYQSHAHNPLTFELENGSLVFTANRKYILSDKQKPGLLGATNGSIVLVNRETGAEKVLVASQPLTIHTPLSTQHEIDVKDQHVTYASLGDFYAKQKGRFEFLEYDVIQGSLSPLTQEGTLYLCYQYLAQRKYAEAFYWLKQIDFRDALSTSSQISLNRMIALARTTDTSPEAAAVALHAWVLFQKAANRMEAEGKPFGSPGDSAAICSVYSRFEHQIPEHFLLNTEDQKLCGMSPQSDKTTSKYPSIRQFLPAPEGSQKTIEKIELPLAELLDSSPQTMPKIHLPGVFINEYNWARLLQEAQDKVYEQTDFISKYPVFTPNYHEDTLLLQDWTTEFEQLFFTTAYEIARGKQGDYERRRLIFKMQAVQKASGGHNLPKCWKYLQLALKYPKGSPQGEAPDLPNCLSYKARYDFVNTCAALAEKSPEKSNPLPSAITSPSETPLRPIAAPIIPARTVEVPSTPLELAPFAVEAVDKGFTKAFFDARFVQKPKAPSPQVSAPEMPNIEALDPEEQEFATMIEAEFEEFAKDFKKGAEINADRQFYTVADPKGVRSDLEKETADLNNQLVSLEASILELANKHDPDHRKTTLYKEAKIEQELSLKKLAGLFLQGDADTFAKANPYLRDARLIEQIASSYNLPQDQNLVIDYLYNQIGLYMTMAVHRNRLQRAISLCKKIEPLAPTDLKRDALVQKLADELKPHDKPTYSIQKFPEFLVYEYMSGLSIRHQQAEFLTQLLEYKNGKYINRVIQAIMGFGKTSLLAVVVLKHAAKMGRLALFVTPASQYASVSYNLRKSLRDYFGIDMEEIDVSREQLSKSATMCDEILTRLQNTVKTGDFLLIKSETLQALGLAFLDFVYQASQEAKSDPVLMHKINTLKDILILLRDKGDGLFDEVSILLNVLQEVNYPVGEPENIAPERIEVIRNLFLLFMSEKVQLDETKTVNLGQVIGIRQNHQNLLGQKTWKEIVAKAVAYNLPRTMESLKLQGRLDLVPSFERYINGTMNVECQRLLDHPDQEGIRNLKENDKLDYDFLSFVRQLRLSKDAAEQEAAHHIALIKHMMQVVIPVTFEKTGKRNYGRGGTKPGEVRPYLAVDTPSENLFGYHWEAIAFHFQTAAQCGIQREQMLHIVQLYKLQAEIQAEREKRVFDQTMEAIEFKDLTGVALHEMDIPEKIDEAIANLNNNIDALLRFEADTAAEYVSYYPLRLTSTGQNLVGMLCTVRAMDGTPWNLPCYPSSLANNFQPAEGTEGQIAEASFARAAQQKEKKYMHITRSTELAAILKDVLDTHPQKERVRLLLDSEAMFKNYSNLEVAKAIRDSRKMPVLFFMRNPHKNEKTPDTLAVLKVGSDNPDIIGGTRLEDIEKTGLNLDDYFVFDDERHTTGTDIPLPPDAIGLMTFGEKMLRKLLYQTIMRERDYFLNQDIEYIIPEYLLEILKKYAPKQDLSNNELTLLVENTVLSIVNQAIAKSKHYYRSCKQKIDAVFRESLWKEFLIPRELTHQDIKDRFPPYQKTTLTEQKCAPYDQFGALEYPVDSLLSLENYRKRKLNHFPQQHHQRALIEAETQKIIEEAKVSRYRPARVLEAGSTDLGMQVDVLSEVAAEVNQETDQDIEQDLLQELEAYMAIKPSSLAKEKDWKDTEIGTFLSKLQDNDSITETPMANLSALFAASWFPYKQNYTSVFSGAIRVTQSWAMATDRNLPVFHRLQRPLDQILIVKTSRGYQAVALSQKETRQFKSYLKRHPAKTDQIWLIQPDETTLQDTKAGSLPIHDPQVQAILTECNVFGGRIDYLDTHEDATLAWLQDKDPSQVLAKKNFLKLKVAKNPLQKKLFFKSEIFGSGQKNENQRKYRWRMVSDEISSLEEPQIKALTAKDSAKMKWLTDKQLNLLKPEQVELLRGPQISQLSKPELVQKIPQMYTSQMTPDQMKVIGEDQVAWFKDSVTKTQAIPARLCHKMEDAQLKNISPAQVAQIEDKNQLLRLATLKPELLAHVTGNQVKKGLVDATIAPHLRSRDAIGELSVDLLQGVRSSLREQFLRASQVSAFKPNQHEGLIQDLTESQVKWLTSEDQLLVLKDEQIPWISDTQIKNHVTSQALIDKLGPRAGARTNASTSIAEEEETERIETPVIEQNRSISKIVFATLGILIAAGILTAGAFALMGALWPNAPHFTIVVYHFFQSPLLMPAIAAGAGTLLCVGLITYAIHECKKPKIQHNISKESLRPTEPHRSVTKIVMVTLGILVAAGILTAGAFALTGGLWPHAPHFTIQVYQFFQSPLFLPSVAAGAGALLFVNLLTFAICECQKPKIQQKVARESLRTSNA